MNRLILLRHGQSQWNLENRFTGLKNVPLTEKGKTEAIIAGQILKKNNINIDIIFSSVLARANETAEITIMVTCIFVVKPRNNINNGTSAILGNEANAQTYGLRIDSIYLFPPINKPPGIPITHAIARPNIKLLKLCRK